jgi:hypothetical protein
MDGLIGLVVVLVAMVGLELGLMSGLKVGREVGLVVMVEVGAGWDSWLGCS